MRIYALPPVDHSADVFPQTLGLNGSQLDNPKQGLIVSLYWAWTRIVVDVTFFLDASRGRVCPTQGSMLPIREAMDHFQDQKVMIS